jgi:hypothetical protein
MTTIITKNSSTSGAAPTAGDLVQGELAVNVTSKGLYTKNASGTVVKLNTPSIVDNGDATAISIDSSENVGIGISSPTALLDVYKASQGGNSTFRASGPAGQILWANGGASTSYLDSDTTIFRQSAASGNAERARIDSSGNLLVGTTSGSANTIYNGGAEGTRVLNLSGASQGCAYFSVTSGGGENAAATAMLLKKNSSTNRSLNAAGTLNASGADYAEYMTKAGAFTIAKGDVIGIDANGKLTNVFADAVSFCVKSTDPSYVGGDVWGNEEALGLTNPEQPVKRPATEDVEAETDEEFAVRQAQYEADKTVFEAALETARQTVDRIAFAGQVPVNVTGATSGQYIVPANNNGSIKGVAVSNPTFEQYQQAVGKVIAIENDGRARIIVKIA